MSTKLVVFLAALAVASPSQAASFDFSYSVAAQNWNDPDIAVSGTYQTTDTADGNGFYTIIGLTGKRGGQSMALAQPGIQFGNSMTDNRLKLGDPYFTEGGLGYSAGGVTYDLYSFYGILAECSGICRNGTTLSNFTVKRAVAAVPEPGSWMLMMAGFGLLGLALRGRRAHAIRAVMPV